MWPFSLFIPLDDTLSPSAPKNELESRIRSLAKWERPPAFSWSAYTGRGPEFIGSRDGSRFILQRRPLPSLRGAQVEILVTDDHARIRTSIDPSVRRGFAITIGFILTFFFFAIRGAPPGSKLTSAQLGLAALGMGLLLGLSSWIVARARNEAHARVRETLLGAKEG